MVTYFCDKTHFSFLFSKSGFGTIVPEANPFDAQNKYLQLFSVRSGSGREETPMPELGLF